ncbi:MAG: ferrous iron transport protein B [Candidatus Cryptobacteroides sp.]
MNTLAECNGQCHSCPLMASKGVRQCIRAAVTGAGSGVSGKTVSGNGFSVRFNILPEISSILDTPSDIVIHIVDALHLEDTLYPVTKLNDMDIKVILVIKNYRKFLETGHSIDTKQLSRMLGMPVITFEPEDGLAEMTLIGKIAECSREPYERKVSVPYGQDVEEAIAKISAAIHKGHDEWLHFSERYVAVRLLEHQDYIMPYVNSLPNADEVLKVAGKAHDGLEKEFGEQSEVLVAKARRGFVAGALQETVSHGGDSSDHTFTMKVDALLTSKWLGFPLLILILLAVFQCTFTIGAYPQGWIESGINALCAWLGSIMSPGWFTSMLIDGIVQGVGAVLAFLPNIVILFFFLSILEDTGYMSRAAFLMDKIMHLVGLHGRSFIPMLIGFGCNVPAIMAAKQIENKRDRTLTMLMIPFMSCSARLPVYLLFVSAFFANYKALVMVSLYAIGIFLSILFAYVMKHTKWFRMQDEDYVSVLPSFRKPTWRNTGMHIWERVSDYLQKISTVILAASVIIWALEYFPADKTGNGENPEESYLAMVGKAVSPVMEPLGFDWKMNVSLLTGLPAKEAIVSTMGILYHSDDGEGNLATVLREEKIFTPANSWAFMLFVLLYFPCVATVSTLRKEIGAKWAGFVVVHSLILAWIVAFLAYRIIGLIM